MATEHVVKVYGSKVKETDKAILWEFIEPTGDVRQEWFPFSQTSEIHPDHIVVTAWIADKKGIYGLKPTVQREAKKQAAKTVAEWEDEDIDDTPY